MSSHAGAGDGPAVLQLQKWSQFQPKLSEFREAFISPTRELLLLLSYQCEALLFSLIADRCYSEGLQRPRSLRFHSQDRTAPCGSDSADNATCSTGHVEIVSNNIFPSGSNFAFDQYPVICDVKSLAWGHCGDGYSQHNGSSFREILVVSGDHDITVHAFCSLGKNNEAINPSPKTGVLHGKWVEWGPTHITQAKDQFNSHSNSCENFCDANEIGRTEGSQHVDSGVGGAESVGSFTPKKWFRTFLTELETSEAEGDFMARFPAKSAFPYSAEVVSFSIYESTLMFLDSRTNSLSNKKSQSGETMPGSAEYTSIRQDPRSVSLHVSSDSPSEISRPEAFRHYGAGLLGNPYQCSRVFSSSSHRYVGLVLTYADDAPINANKENTRHAEKTLVIVVIVCQWGMQWVCSVDLQGSCLGPSLESVWADFQFSDNFLVCLNTSGLICIWDAKTGNAVAHLDVLRSCGVDLKVQSELNQSKHPVKGDSSLMMERFSTEVERRNEVPERETYAEGYVSARRIFRRLLVASYSFLLAAIDECGVIYVICADDYVSEKHACGRVMPPFQHSDLGILAGWKVAASEIGRQKVYSDFSYVHGLNFSSDSNGSFYSIDNTALVKHRKNKRQCILVEGNQLDSYSSGFSAASLTKNCQIPHSEISLTPIRRVFLPIDRFNTEVSICLSPFGITRLAKSCNINEQTKIVHTCLHVASSVHDERDLNKGLHSQWFSSFHKESAPVGEAIGCCSQGCFYLVTQDGLSVVLPSLSVSSGVLPVESIRCWRPSTDTGSGYQTETSLFSTKDEHRDLWRPWQLEILDRTLLYEGPEEADNICLENEWDLKIVRVRQMELALYYLKPDEIERSLEMLADVNLAEEGILRLLFASVYKIFCKVGSENEVALALRLLTLAACFATKMVRRYGLLDLEKDRSPFNVDKGLKISYPQPTLPNTEFVEISNSRRLQEMAHFLEIIRNLQCRLSAKCRRLGQVVDGRDASNLVDTNMSQDESPLPILSLDSVSSLVLDASEVRNQGDKTFPTPDLATDGTDELALSPSEPSVDMGISEFYMASGGVQGRKTIHWENPKDMITRWEIENLDLKTVVEDALHSGRLPLAVLQRHLQRVRELVSEEEHHDSFSEVRDVGRAIAYDLFLKGESGLAIATLQRLGEDIEISLRQLVFGTVRRSIRIQIAEEMKRFGYLKLHEQKTLERLSLIERLYPSSSFWGTYLGRQKESSEAASNFVLPEENRLFLNLHMWDNFTIECGEIDGVVIGTWTNISKDSAFLGVDEDTTDAGYWACAAVWSDSWDQRIMDRIVLDQPLIMGIHVPWESQLEYHLAHNDWQEIQKLLDMIPTSILSAGTLKINLASLHPVANAGCNEKFPGCATYICSTEELEPVCIDIPNVKLFNFSVANMCSAWLRVLLEQELAKKLIFLKEYWESTAEIMPLLARAGLIIDISKGSIKTVSPKISPDLHLSHISENFNQDTAEALHKLVIHHCAQYNLLNLLDIYLDHHKLVLDNDTLCRLLEASGGCQWAKWLMFSRVKGREYDASFSNARSILSRHMVLGSNLSVLEVDEIIRTVDDMAEGGGEMAALATLMYAPNPIQKCLCSGSVSRHCSSSAQCTLENLRPALQHFPTLWRTLVAACFGHDADGCSLSHNSNNVFSKSSLSDYLKWRDNIFSSAGGDTSLLQMLPCWFPKPIRQLVKLFVQGPLGWQTVLGAIPAGESFLHRDNACIVNATENTMLNGISWEAAIQKSIEEELYSSVEENKLGVEHHLHRGRALAAFNHLLDLRVLKCKSTRAHQELSGGLIPVQTNIQSDVQTLLGPLTQNEGPLISSVMPLAIMHFEDSVLVASCAFLLELCGLSASMLCVDVAVLQRISSYYKSINNNAHYEHVALNGSAFHAVTHEGDFTISLARALADDYLRHENLNIFEQMDAPLRVEASKQPPRALITVLQHLEKASLPLMDEGKTCGSWLVSGSGDGSEFRSLQKAASQHWNLVIAFCQMHHLPLSTKYLALLAKDNDWVGFLTEGHVGGFPFDTVIQVAAKEFSDPRLRIHILTVLKSMQSTRKRTSSPTNSTSTGKINEMPFLAESNMMTSVELFGLVAECERQKNPGEALLIKAKDLRWSLLAMIASCFPEVSPLSCLTVWLEITAARETSSIKVNDISSQIASNVGAAVESTNALPTSSRDFTFSYNRRNPKRRRQMEPTSGNRSAGSPFNVPGSSISTKITVPQEITTEREIVKVADERTKFFSGPDEGLLSLSNMVAVLCEQHLFLPLLRAFEMFLPSCSLLPFIRFLQALSQMRLPEASAHLASFSARIKEEPYHMNINITRDGQIRTTWISSTAVKAADAILSTCPSAYEKRCLLQLLAATDFGDGGAAATCFRRQYWKINLAEPSLRKDDDLYLGNEILDDASLLMTLEKSGHWEQARNWAKQLESSGAPWNLSANHVTETQAEAMVAEWKEFLWDVPEERAALWSHCQTLFLRYSFPALQAGKFFLKHAEATEKDIPARELHEMLLLSLQWLSGTITQSNPVYPLHLLREIETRVWLLAVESEVQSKAERDLTLPSSLQNPADGNSTSIIEHTASIITKMDNHINAVRTRATEKNGTKESNQAHSRLASDSNTPSASGSSTRMKRRTKTYLQQRRFLADSVDKNTESDEYSSFSHNIKNNSESFRNPQEENVRIEMSFSGWEERLRPAELERAVLSLLEFGQITAARQLQQKLSPTNVPSELVIVDAALKLAANLSPCSSGEVSASGLDSEVCSVIQLYDIPSNDMADPLQVLESLATKCSEGCGRGLCKRIIAVVKAANVLGLSFSEAFEKQPVELLQLLSLKAQDSLEEASLLVQTHVMPPASIARILAESFLKGLLAAHRGGYMDSQKDEGPAPLLWRFSDFLKWAELCPSEPEIGHALMRLVITGQEIPHACEVELLILAHHFYKSSACLDGVDVLVALAANRVESYVLEGDFSCLARLVTGVSNFHALNFILGILIENGQLELLLQKYSAAETATGTAEAVRGFRMAVLTALKHFNPHDLDAFAMVYNHFDMKHETASLLESRSNHSMQQWLLRRDKDRQNEDLLESMRYLIEAAEVHSTIDAGQKTHRTCARASLLSLQIRIPDLHWLDLSETNARRALVEQSRFQEALIVAEAYGLNQPSEWALVLWNQMLRPDLIEQFVAEFVIVLPLQSSMLLELARFYRAEVAARGDQSHFSVWLSPGGLPAEWVKHLGRSFRSLLRRTRDLRVRVQLATIATGFSDVIDACMKVLDKVPDTAGPLILRKGHGGAYLPLM